MKKVENLQPNNQRNYKFLTQNYDNRIIGGRPKNYWWHYLKIDLKKCKIFDGNKTSIDRDGWKRSIEELQVRQEKGEEIL